MTWLRIGEGKRSHAIKRYYGIDRGIAICGIGGDLSEDKAAPRCKICERKLKEAER